MAEYSRLARGKFVSTGQAQVVNLPFRPDRVRLINLTVAQSAAATQLIPYAEWDAYMGQGTAVIQGYNANPALIFDNVSLNGISTFYAGQLLQYGPPYAHLSVATADFSISKADPAVVTTVTAHGLKSGDVVVFEGLFQTSTTGMAQLNGIPFTVTVINSTSFSIPWNTNQSNYTAFDSATSTGNIGLFKQVLYPYLYFPGVSFISAITASNGTSIPVGTVQVDTTDAHNFVVGQEVAFRIPSQWGSVELNSLPDVLIPGSPLYGYVDSIVDYNSVIVRIDAAPFFTPFFNNQTIASVPGLSYAQIVAVGDVNTGGVQISSGSVLYPSPVYRPIGNSVFPTINGPAIQGAFVNNTSMGFVVGAGAGDVLTTGSLVGSAEDILIWEAFLHDYSNP